MTAPAATNSAINPRAVTGFAKLTVAQLPAAGVAKGYRCFVSDATVAASGNFGAIVAGSGTNFVPVYSDGTNWRIG